MMPIPVLQSLIADRWVGTEPASLLRSAIDGSAVAHTHAETLDFAQAVHHARTVGVPALLRLDFQQRAGLLKALAGYLLERKEALYTLSRHTGATRADSWIDIEGGTGTLFAYAGVGAGDLPSGNVVHEGPALSLGKTGVFAGTHILVPRRGVAVHINAFNFPIWGLLEKFAPSFLAGMPCIGKPATATSYLTEAVVRLIQDSGLLPPGSLQLVIGGTGDLLDRLTEPDVVTFTGSADTAARLRVHPNLVARSIPFTAEADSLNCAVLAPEVGPDDEAFELFVKEVEAFREESAGLAFYQGPGAFDGRPGTYYINTFDMKAAGKYEMEALAYHEGIPGHHMQIAIAQELQDVPSFRKFGNDYTAYVEGWGLYCERLPKEMGFYKDPYSDFGRLSMELWRACRLVVDAGLHAPQYKWTREKAIQYLFDNTPGSDSDVVGSIERYIVMPGQATAYTIGMAKIIALREAAKKKLGAKFDLRQYHDVVLRSGALPLTVLEEQVDAWVKSKSA